jgi:hypothetical protein
LSPSPEQIEYAEMHRLARGDLYACRKLADDAEIDDHIVGFHAQQAVEKALKVALAGDGRRDAGARLIGRAREPGTASSNVPPSAQGLDVEPVDASRADTQHAMREAYRSDP